MLIFVFSTELRYTMKQQLQSVLVMTNKGSIAWSFANGFILYGCVNMLELY